MGAELGLVAVKQSYKQLKHASATYAKNAPVVQGEAKPIALLSFNLPSSMVLSMHASYDAQEARAVQRSASEGKIRQLRQDAAEKFRELKQKLSEVFENCRFADLPEPVQKIIDDIIHIVKELYHDFLNSALVAELKECWQTVKAYAQEISQWIHNHFKAAKEQAKRLRKEIAQACENAKQYLEENHREAYEQIKQKIEQFKEYLTSSKGLTQYIRESKPAKYLRQKLNEAKAKYPEQWQVLEQVASKVYEQLEKDAARAKSYCMRFGTFRRAAEIYNAEQSGKRMSELASAIQRNFLFSFKSEKGYITLFAPLAQPSYSVPSAVASIGLPRSPMRGYRAASASYTSYMSGNFMRNYLPPHSHMAILAGSSLTTFNGATIHMKPSTCTYKLAASQDTQIYVT